MSILYRTPIDTHVPRLAASVGPIGLTNDESGNTLELAKIVRQDLVAARESRCRNDQIVRADWRAIYGEMRPDLSVSASSIKVEGYEGQEAQNALDIGRSSEPTSGRVGTMNADEQLGGGHARDN